jgi:hypothetical protein
MRNRGNRFLLTACTALCMAFGTFGAPVYAGQSAAPPKYEVDPTWPKNLPGRWVLGQIGGLCIDSQDHIFALNRRDIEDNNELDAGEQAPAIIEFDPAGNVVKSWGDLDLLPSTFFHGCTFDKEDNMWLVSVGDGILQKWSRDGKLLLQVGKKGVIDSSDGTARGKALNSSHTQFFRPAGIAIDETNGDVYIADGEAPNANHRVVVLDKTGKFLRQWEIRKKETDPADWVPVLHCIAMDKDGNVYVCDRRGQRFQIFDKKGTFKRYVDIPFKQRTPYPATEQFKNARPGSWGASVYLTFSTDPEQKYIVNINESAEQIDFIDRSTLQIVGSFGRPGHQLGGMTHAHFAPMDSMGNIYVGEVFTGRRIQKFKPVP